MSQNKAAKTARVPAAARSAPRPAESPGPLAVVRGAVERFGIYALILVYVAINLPLLAAKGTSIEEIRVFSVDESLICAKAKFMIQNKTFTYPGQPGGSFAEKMQRELANGQRGYSAHPFPYGQLYLILITVPLLVLQSVMSISEYLIVRWAVLVLILSGIAVLAITYRIGSRLYAPLYGLAAAVLVLLTPEFLRWSNELHPDMPQLALMLASFDWALVLYERTRTAAFDGLVALAWAAFFAGAAMATKFNGVFLLPVIGVAYNRPFLLEPRRLGLRRFVIHNLTYGGLCLAVFCAAFAVFSPFYVANPEFLRESLSRPTAYSVGNTAAFFTGGGAAGTNLLVEKIQNIWHSNEVIITGLTGYGMYAASLAGMLYAASRLLRRYAEELQSPKILAEAFNCVFLGYSFIGGYALVGGRLLHGYERYLLPAVPLLYISSLRIFQLILAIPQLPQWIAAALIAVLMLDTPTKKIDALYQQAHARYLLKEQGFFKVNSWVRQHIPPGSSIYTEWYIFVPTQGYRVYRDYAVYSLDRMQASDYVITKTLSYNIYADPDRFKNYENEPNFGRAVVESKRVYELLESNALPGFHKIAVLSISGERYGDDTVVVYENLNRRTK